eukprot:1158773-Pelagomonas_calceolata.AAC.24
MEVPFSITTASSMHQKCGGCWVASPLSTAIHGWCGAKYDASSLLHNSLQHAWVPRVKSVYIWACSEAKRGLHAARARMKMDSGGSGCILTVHPHLGAHYVMERQQLHFKACLPVRQPAACSLHGLRLPLETHCQLLYPCKPAAMQVLLKHGSGEQPASCHSFPFQSRRTIIIAHWPPTAAQPGLPALHSYVSSPLKPACPPPAAGSPPRAQNAACTGMRCMSNRGVAHLSRSTQAPPRQCAGTWA